MDRNEEGLRKALALDRYDRVTRLALADWLEETDRPEEAMIHRAWTAEKERAAEEFLDELAHVITNGNGRVIAGQIWTGDALPAGEKMSRQDLIEAAQAWLSHREPLWLPMNNAGLSGRQFDETFWQCVAILTDQQPPAKEKGYDFVRCSC